MSPPLLLMISLTHAPLGAVPHVRLHPAALTLVHVPHVKCVHVQSALSSVVDEGLVHARPRLVHLQGSADPSGKAPSHKQRNVRFKLRHGGTCAVDV
jgi:hypothetical protein